MRPLLKQSHKNLALVALVLILFTGIGARFYNLSSRMTSIDDIGFLPELAFSKSAWEAGGKVSGLFTYGPLQFVASWYLSHGATDWDNLMTRVRIPSAVFSSLGLVLSAILLLYLSGLNWVTLFLISLVAFSVRSIIEAQQAYVYAATFFATSYLLLMLAFYQSPKDKWKGYLVMMGPGIFGVTFLPLLSYQIMSLLPFFCMILAYSVYKDMGKDLLTTRKGILTSLVFLGSYGFLGFRCYRIFKFQMMPLFNLGYRPFPYWVSENWPKMNHGFLGNIWAFVNYYIHRLMDFFFYQLTPVWPSMVPNFVIVALSGGGVLLFFLSLYVAWRDSVRQREWRPWLFSLLVFTQFTILNFARVNPLGGTRHSYVLLLLVLVILLPGLRFLAGLIQKRMPQFNSYIWGAVVAGIPLAFWLNYHEFHFRTQEHYDIGAIEKMCQAEGISKLGEFDWTGNYYYANLFLKAYKSCKKHDVYKNGDIEDFFDELLEQKKGTTYLATTHRQYLIGAIQEKAASPEYAGELQLKILRKEDPTGSTEPIGIINEGNGFYAISVRRL